MQQKDLRCIEFDAALVADQSHDSAIRNQHALGRSRRAGGMHHIERAVSVDSDLWRRCQRED